MSLHKKTRDTIDALFAAGQQPVKLKTSEGIGILNGRRPIVLVTAAGVKTNAGTYYEQKSETNLPDGGFLQQDARRDGNVETILLRDGRRGESLVVSTPLASNSHPWEPLTTERLEGTT